MKFITAIRFCDIHSISFHKIVERIDVCHTEEYRTIGFCGCCINGKANFRPYFGLDGRSKKQFPCVSCSFQYECEKLIIETTSSPLILLSEKEC